MESVPNPAVMRRRYSVAGLHEDDLAADPVTQFARWFADATAAGLVEPNAMVLATASAGGVPSARTVLLKGYGERGFVFYTNRGSRKAMDLADNPRAELVFPWHAIERQVRVSGPVGEVPADEADRYFSTRPRGAQLGAWASAQSEVVAGRDALDDKLAEAARRWPEGTPVPRPDFWGGFLVVPEAVEFWQGREGRMHDRLRYRRDGARWTVERLAP